MKYEVTLWETEEEALDAWTEEVLSEMPDFDDPCCFRCSRIMQPDETACACDTEEENIPLGAERFRFPWTAERRARLEKQNEVV